MPANLIPQSVPTLRTVKIAFARRVHKACPISVCILRQQQIVGLPGSWRAAESAVEIFFCEIIPAAFPLSEATENECS